MWVTTLKMTVNCRLELSNVCCQSCQIQMLVEIGMRNSCFLVLQLWIRTKKTWTPTPTLGLIAWHMIVCLKMTWEKFLNSSNRKCTVVYMQSFNSKINCTKVKWTATKLHKSPDETDRAQSWSLLQMRDFDSDFSPKPGLSRTPIPHSWLKYWVKSWMWAADPATLIVDICVHVCVCMCFVGIAGVRATRAVCSGHYRPRWPARQHEGIVRYALNEACRLTVLLLLCTMMLCNDKHC